jgi:O-antigen/teichoic acid export membrane protein
VPAGDDRPLLQQASRAALWNALLLPLLSVLNLAFAVVIRRRFGLFSGVYDVLLGLLSALLLYSGVGIPSALSKFLPEVAALSGAQAVGRFLRQAAIIRLGCLALLLVPLNLLAEPVSSKLGLGPDGPIYIALMSGLTVARAVLQFMSQALNAFFAQLRSNLFALAQAALDIALVGLALFVGFEMAGVLGGLLASASVVALASVTSTRRLLSRAGAGMAEAHGRQPADRRAWFDGEADRVIRFSAFSYLFGFLGFFTDMGFAAPALALTLAPAQVALFATAFKLTFMTVVLVVSGFRGLYQPVFARLRIRNDPRQLQQAFAAVSKAQLVLLVPAGMGLMVMSGDYIPLLFGAEFRPAVPISWVLVGLMYAETAFNLPNIILSVDERYRALFWTQAVAIVAAPLFVITAGTLGLIGAAIVLGGSRLATALAGYSIGRRAYGLRFPWSFALKVGTVGLVMAVTIGTARLFWSTSPAEALTLTALGMLVYLVGLRIARVLGPEEIDLIRRSQVPGHAWVVAWLAPSAFVSRTPPGDAT